MRVITGTARGRRLETLEGLDVRPTIDRVKEAMFSAIHFEIEGSEVLDLFSGSGQLGIEAISRGAKSCTFVDASLASLKITRKNISTVGFESQAKVFQGDFKTFLNTARSKYHIVFLDPPYSKGIIPEALELLQDKLFENAKIVCEHELEAELPELVGKIRMKKQYKYGKTKVTIYQFGGDEE